MIVGNKHYLLTLEQVDNERQMAAMVQQLRALQVCTMFPTILSIDIEGGARTAQTTPK